MSDAVFDRLTAKLDAEDVAYSVLRHAAVFTSQEAADVRGTSLASGAKALVCKIDDAFAMFVLPADRKLASKAARQAAGAKSLRFANREEVERLTGLAPGSIPPFGSLFDLPTWCDNRLGDEESINFNAGDHTISIGMSFAEFVRVERPTLGVFAE